MVSGFWTHLKEFRLCAINHSPKYLGPSPEGFCMYYCLVLCCLKCQFLRL